MAIRRRQLAGAGGESGGAAFEVPTDQERGGHEKPGRGVVPDIPNEPDPGGGGGGTQRPREYAPPPIGGAGTVSLSRREPSIGGSKIAPPDDLFSGPRALPSDVPPSALLSPAGTDAFVGGPRLRTPMSGMAGGLLGGGKSALDIMGAEQDPSELIMQLLLSMGR